MAANGHQPRSTNRRACLAALAGGVFAYAVVMVTATSTGKYGKHLLQAFGGG